MKNLIVQQEAWELPTKKFGLGQLTGLSYRCPGKETSNEDALLYLPLGSDQGILVLADGAGGTPGGQDASKLIVEECLRKFRRIRTSAHLGSFVLAALDRANAKILKAGNGSGSTVVVVEIYKRRIRSYHAGDSAMRVVGQRGAVKRQTVSHSPVGYVLASGIVDGQHPYCIENRHFVDNLVGHEEMRIEVGAPYRLAKKDTLLIASDGITDNFTESEIIEIIRKGDLDQVRTELHEKVVVRMSDDTKASGNSRDDFSFFLFRLN